MIMKAVFEKVKEVNVTYSLLLVTEGSPLNTKEFSKLSKGGAGVLGLDLITLLLAEVDVGRRGCHS